ncbi:MAG: hypothetical protein HFJ51_02505 [Clostridia bacterium]|nr:hypothetical protein [Clostridia bacterium]
MQAGIWQKKEGYNNLKLRLNLLVEAKNENRVKVAEIIKKNLEAIRNTSYNNSCKRLDI